MSRLCCWALLCSSSIALAQPGIGQNGVFNRASQIPTTLSGGSIARGAAFTIRGVHFGSTAVVSLRKGAATLPVRVLAVQAEKIEALMPDAAPIGPAALVVTAGRSSSKPFSVVIADSNPGVFSQNKNGWGPGEIQNLDASGKRTLNSNTNPAAPGEKVAMKITGLGKLSAAEVVIGNRPVNAGAARPTSQPGEQEISFAIPQDAPRGCYVPVYLQTAPARASNVVTIAIRSGAGPKCDLGPVPDLDAKRIGMIVVTRTNMYKSGGNINKGEVKATFTVRDPSKSLSPLLLLPPPGTCTAYTGSLQSPTNAPITSTASLFGEIGNEGLAAGSQLTIGRDKRWRIIPWDRNAIGYYRGPVPLRLFSPGKLVLSGPGGLDVGAFRIGLNAPAPFEWIDRQGSGIVTRSRGLLLRWRGLATGHRIIILATNVDQISTASGTCLCSAPLNATHFEIPAAMLANIPASSDTPGAPYDQVFMISLPDKPIAFAAPGIGAGALFTIYSNGRVVQFH